MSALRLGVAGLGWWGCALAEAAQRLTPDIALALCFSPEEGERRAFSARFGARPCGSFEALIAAPGVDAILLATPHSLHAAQIEAAARAGKHVFVEKPLALGVAEGARAVEACRAAGVTLAVGHNRRLLAGIGRIKAWIEEGRLGTLLQVEANFSTSEGAALTGGHWRASRSESLGGPLAPLGIHVIDWLHWLFGPVAEAAAFIQRRAIAAEIDDTAAALFRFRSGMTGYLGCLYAAPYTSELAVYGSAAKAVLRAAAPDAPDARPTLLLQPAAGPAVAEAPPWVDTLALQLRRFAEAARGRGEVAVGGEEALANVALMEAILASAADGGRPAAPRYWGGGGEMSIVSP